MNDAPGHVGTAEITSRSPAPGETAGKRSVWRSTSYLTLFAAAMILPILLFAVVLAWLYVGSERDRSIRRAHAAAEELVAAVDGTLAGPRIALQALASSSALHTGDMETFRQLATETARVLGAAIVVTAPGASQPLLSTAADGQPPLSTLDPLSQEYQSRAVASKEPVVGNLVERSGSFFVGINIPVLRDGAPVYVLSAEMPASTFAAALSEVRMRKGWAAELVDQDGKVIAATVDAAGAVGRRMPAEWSQNTNGSEGIWYGRGLEGIDVAAAHVRSPATGWTTAVAVPLAGLNAPAWRAAGVLVAIGGILLALAVGLASWIGARLTGALSALKAAAVRLAELAEVPPVVTPVEEVNQVGSALSAAAAEAVRREAYLRAIVATVPSAMVIIDNKGIIHSVSATAEQLFGYKADEIVGRNVQVLMPEPHRNDHDSYLARYLRTGERHIIGHSRVVYGVKRNGKRFPHELNVGEMDVAGRKMFIGFMRDQTERQRIEQELRQTQKMEAIGKLTGGVAHDFNNLLTVIKGNLEMLEARLDGRYAEVIGDAQEAADLAARLTSSLLAFGRQMPLNPVLSDIGQLVTATGDLLRRTLGETIEIKTSIKVGCWAIVDGPQLQNSLLNLAINARDAMPEGGVLSIEVSEEELDQDYAAAYAEVRLGRYVLVRVSDTGAGMTPEVKERAFEPFFTTKPQGSGTGLGLSSVYGFVKQSGGHIALYSEQGQGTTIRVYLPAMMREAAGGAQAATGASSLPRGRGERVLLVEDDDRVRRVTVARLESLGYSVLQAVSARDALDLLEKQPNVDLLFTDMVMPGGMSGAELALEVRRRLPSLPVLFTSGYAEPETVKDVAIEHDQWLGKPYTAADLAKRLRTIFDKRRR